MTIQMEAVYENGVFRPLQPVPLAEHQRVTINLDAEAPAEALPKSLFGQRLRAYRAMPRRFVDLWITAHTR
jgi:predicted DNA-binding antitoxin AbrB/MazE fold protein